MLEGGAWESSVRFAFTGSNQFRHSEIGAVEEGKGMMRVFKRVALAILSLALLSSSVLTACATGSSLTVVTDVTAARAFALIEENRSNPAFSIVDVRTPEEFAEGHIAGAANVDFGARDFREQIGNLERDGIYLVYCRTGNRSSQAIDVMKDLDFERIYHLARGITEWTAAGLEVVR